MITEVWMNPVELEQRFTAATGYYPTVEELEQWFHQEHPGCQLHRVWQEGMVNQRYLIEFKNSWSKTLFLLKW